ncbi:uncharacterized protein TRIADDRAFT_57526 [Trichoplax adhaerens]|uniref:Uncharacterized protein n=1 Tax=Trichoplax adhaerens TaxID=10228 RepID=B3RZP2_TRIAD|nr:hypothetical protein TRIADDRAFT_57526 [Trichoplax adhaerens]EDV24239.1 hypothetical protein TRIADDRAFT_57526 [Trichoplax adhaerens]|eukprot:XP_002113765.1 hypothetical protein TRIADDRAFT_57526 [Trichoplax adhaerens]
MKDKTLAKGSKMKSKKHPADSKVFKAKNKNQRQDTKVSRKKQSAIPSSNLNRKNQELVAQDSDENLEELELSPKMPLKANPFSDENAEWLKLAAENDAESDKDSDEAIPDEFDELPETEELPDEASLNGSDINDSEYSDDDSEDDVSINDIMKLLPIEKASQKLDKKLSRNRKLAEEELKTNIAQSEVFVLPSGQEIEKENIL